jgi:hypothetical protein
MNRSCLLVYTILAASAVSGAARSQTLDQSARKPPPGIQNGTICYTAAWGKDVNDGLSWGSAKATIMACYDALPQKGGTIFIAQNGNGDAGAVAANEAPGGGIWIMGANDPNYNNPNFFPPNGPWRKLKVPSVRFVGVASSSQMQNGHKGGVVRIGAGSARDNNHPCIWLSATAGYLYFENLGCFYPGRGIVIGEASNHDRSGIGSVSGEYFENVSSGTPNVVGLGPTVDITGGSFWLWFDHCIFEGNYQNNVKDDKRAAILMDGKGNNGVGLTYLTNLNLNGGGIKYVPGATSGQIDIHVLTEEGNYTQPIPPAVWITNTSGSLFRLSQILVADPGSDPPPAIKIDTGNPNDVLVDTAMASNGAPNVEGPATIMNQYGSMLLNQTVSPIQQGQDGFFNYHVIGQVDAARRNFGPTVVRFPNLAPQIPSGWIKSVACGSVNLRVGVTGPDGTTNAAEAEATCPSPFSAIDFYQRGHSIGVGDFIIAGAWVRSVTGNGFAGSTTQPMSAGFTGVKYAATGSSHGSMNENGGEWSWVWSVQKITLTSAKTGQLNFGVNVAKGKPIEIFAPVLIYLTAGAVSDNEAYEIALNLASYPDAAPPGSVAMLRGEDFSLGSHLNQLAANGDLGGRISISGAINGSKTFGAAFALPPVCVVSPTSNPGTTSWWVTTSTSAITINLSAPGTLTFDYTCHGNPD